jgi:hypothetical protein
VIELNEDYMKSKIIALAGAAALMGLGYQVASAVDFNTGVGDISGAWITNVTGALGFRTKDPSCSLTGDPNAGGSGACGASASTALWANGDDGDLNTRKDNFYTKNLDVVSELLLKSPEEGWKFLVRGQAIYDFAITDAARTPVSPDGQAQSENSESLLDLFVEKDFSVGVQSGHVRVGNQVINWGESYYAFGGVNSTSSLDIQKLSTPGTLLKQVLLPAPMVEFESSLPGRFSFEGYVQAHWNANRYPPPGTYWSFNDVFNRTGTETASFSTTNFNFSGPDAGTIAGAQSRNIGVINQINQNLMNGEYFGAPYNSFGVPYTTENNPRDRAQYGFRLNYKPEHAQADFSAYYLNYSDKAPVLTYYNAESSAVWSYLTNRILYGVSSNFQLADWAIGTELSYRPHDAVAMSGCYGAGGFPDANTNLAAGNCAAYKDFKKYQFDINGQLIMSRSSYPFIKYLGATQAVLTTEFTYIEYPGVDPNRKYYSSVGGNSVYQMVDAEYVTWPNYKSGLGYPIAGGQGTAGSAGVTADFNWTYDGTLIHGWAVTTGATFFDAFHGYTPNFSANYEVGYKSENLYAYFFQNPAVWNAGINYTMFFGGSSLTQPYSDRNYIGLFVTRNF